MNGLNNLFHDSTIQILKDNNISDDSDLILFTQGMRREGPAELLSYLSPEDILVVSSDLLSFYSDNSKQYLEEVVGLKTLPPGLFAELNLFQINGRSIKVISMSIDRMIADPDRNIQLLNILLGAKMNFSGFIVSDAIMNGVPSYSGVQAIVAKRIELGFNFITILKSAFERRDHNFFNQEL